jgi:hypothetical protein
MQDLLTRLNAASVEKRYEAYADVGWDEPAMAVAFDDPRFELPPEDPLAHTEWYRSQPPEVRSRIGLYRIASCLKTGAHFENLLQRGLLVRAMRLRDGSPEFRYIHHEIVEESQHTMMFQEVINRSGLRVRGMPRAVRSLIEVVVLPVSGRLPMLFFLGVLAGEDPIDHVQRSQLRGGTLHPLMERITRIHVTEEARHVSYARAALIEGVPRLNPVRRHALAVIAPLVLRMLTGVMLIPPAGMRREFHIPRRVMRSAYRSQEGQRFLRASVQRTRVLCRDAGLMTPAGRLAWRVAGLWEPDTAELIAAS